MSIPIERNKEEYISSFAKTIHTFLETNEFDEVNGFVTDTIIHFRSFKRKKEAPIILELGCGSGHLTRLLSNKLQPLQLVCVDFSEDMIGRIKHESQSMPFLRLVCEDMLALCEPSGKYDVIASSFALHHLLPQERAALFVKCHQWLKPDGFFVNGDVFTESDEKALQFITAWHDGCLKLKLTESEYKARVEHRKHECRCTVQEQVDALLRTGFPHVVCVFKHLDRAVIIAFAS